jgi:hypothetical protein
MNYFYFILKGVGKLNESFIYATEKIMRWVIITTYEILVSNEWARCLKDPIFNRPTDIIQLILVLSASINLVEASEQIWS